MSFLMCNNSNSCPCLRQTFFVCLSKISIQQHNIPISKLSFLKFFSLSMRAPFPLLRGSPHGGRASPAAAVRHSVRRPFRRSVWHPTPAVFRPRLSASPRLAGTLSPTISRLTQLFRLHGLSSFHCRPPEVSCSRTAARSESAAVVLPPPAVATDTPLPVAPRRGGFGNGIRVSPLPTRSDHPSQPSRFRHHRSAASNKMSSPSSSPMHTGFPRHRHNCAAFLQDPHRFE